MQVLSSKEGKAPIKSIISTSFLYVKKNDVYIVAVTRSNVDTVLVFEFLYHFIKLMTEYFGGFDDETVQANFVGIYELLDGELLTPISAG